MNQNSNWKTYINYDYHFQIQYPKNLIHDTRPTSTRDYGDNFNTTFTGLNADDSRILLLVWVGLNKKTFNAAFGLEGSKKVASSTIKVDGSNALLEVWKPNIPGDGIYTEYIITSEDKPFLILYRNYLQKDSDSLQEIKAILSTFKFSL